MLTFFATGEFLLDRLHFHELPNNVVDKYGERLRPMAATPHPVEAASRRSEMR